MSSCTRTRRTAEQEVEDLTAIADRLRTVPGARFGYLTAQLGNRVAQARVAWAGEVATDSMDSPEVATAPPHADTETRLNDRGA